MKTKKILIETIELLEEFEKLSDTDNEISMQDFIAFLQNSISAPENADRTVKISQNISFLHRYSKFYIKKALKDTSLQTVDEYTYLAALFNKESLSKTEVNNINVMEKTSGNEVMKRLLKAKLIDERRDEDDKRRMRVSITEKGRSELRKLFPELRNTAKLISGVLTSQEEELFLQLTDKLCNFHKNIFLNFKDCEINEMLNKLPAK